jgi:hypothetical protein
LRHQRAAGLTLSQTQELVARPKSALSEPWNKKIGRPRSCGLCRAVQTARMRLRQNATEEFLGDLLGISQPTVSRIVTALAPIVRAVLEEIAPDVQEAIEMVKGRVCLVDGAITRAGPTTTSPSCGAASTARQDSTRNW